MGRSQFRHSSICRATDGVSLPAETSNWCESLWPTLLASHLNGRMGPLTLQRSGFASHARMAAWDVYRRGASRLLYDPFSVRPSVRIPMEKKSNVIKARAH